MSRKGEIQVALTTRSLPMYFSAKFRRLSTTLERARVRRFVRALLVARGEADSSRRMTMNRFCTIDRISLCRSFVALENRCGLCPGERKYLPSATHNTSTYVGSGYGKLGDV